ISQSKTTSRILSILYVQLQMPFENNSFNKIPTVDSPYKEDEKYLDILNDGGNFAKHIEYLRNERLRIITLEKNLNELKSNQRRY
ncbi:MAG: hypothetical protein PUC65_00490, partial [Clostridiales bacterium]|nr:hypothetical protein [Clostridiales bacterium]